MKDSDWRLLIVLHEKRSMTKAAEALYMTQSALTKRIRAIEDEWHVEIVKRSSQGVLFTEEGQYLVRKANIMVDFLKEIEQHFSERNTSKELLKIGVPNSFSRLHMPALLREYMDRYNRIHIKTVANSSDAIIQQLTDGTVDIGIICGDYPYIGEKICLFEEELYVITQRDQKLDDIAHMPLIESYFNPMVKLTVYQWWKNQFGNLPGDTHRVPYADIAIEMVENGLGNTYLFGSVWKINEEKLQRIPIYDKNNQPVKRKVWMMISEKCFHSQDIMDFISLVEEYYHVNI
ncbi:MAG: LysR family transcriptional regulator [Lachnospiraceae bacterium]